MLVIFSIKLKAMPPYDWTRFAKQIVVNIPVQEAYLAWTLGDALEQWFLKEAKFVNAYGNNRDADSPIQVGDTYIWRWFGWDGHDQGEILEANGKDKLVFTFAGPCKVTVSFKQQGSGTLVELLQENIPTDDESKAKLHVSCIQGWTFYMANLKSIYEGGIDLRNKEQVTVTDTVNA